MTTDPTKQNNDAASGQVVAINSMMLIVLALWLLVVMFLAPSNEIRLILIIIGGVQTSLSAIVASYSLCRKHGR